MSLMALSRTGSIILLIPPLFGPLRTISFYFANISDLRRNIDPILRSKVEDNLIINYPDVIAAVLKSYKDVELFRPLKRRYYITTLNKPIPGSVTYNANNKLKEGNRYSYNWSYILEFNRLRVVRSTPFNINKEGKTFIIVEELGFNPTIIEEYKERPKEGLLLKEVTEADIKNIARYYYYKTVLTNNEVDNVLANMRRGLSNTRRVVYSEVIISLRTSSPFGAKRDRSRSNFRKSVYELMGLLSGIKGHESLLDATEDDGFLINLNLAIKTDRKNAFRAPSKTRTKVFIAIGALYGEDYSFIHDLESFFSLSRHRHVLNTKTLIKIKKGSIPCNVRVLKVSGIDKEDKFIKEVDKNITTYCALLIPYIKELRKVVFLKGKRWLRED
ncbi:serine/threonine-protein kinase [Cenococcum geophilum]